MEDLTVKINGKEYQVKVEETEEGKIRVYCDGEVYDVEANSPIRSDNDDAEQVQGKTEKHNVVVSPLPGTIYGIDVKVGEEVQEGKRLATLMAMKMESEIRAPKNGTIKEIKIKKNDNVNRGDVLFILE